MPHPRRLTAALAALACTAALAACGAAGAQSEPTWVPQNSPSAAQIPTIDPPQPPGGGGSGSGSSSPSNPNSSGPPPSGSPSSSAQDPVVVATGLTTPTGIAVLPDSTALVGERSTGRIVQVQPEAGKPVTPVRTLSGLSTTDGGGLLDLALAPSYAQTGLILALITTPGDTRVVQFTAGGPVTPVLTGIPRGSSDNTGRLFVLNDTVYVGTGDAGSASAADSPTSLAGKVLRVDDLGQPAPGNPSAGSRVFAGGFRTVDGLCADDAGLLFQTQDDGDGSGELNLVRAGQSYSSGGTALPGGVTGVGGCAIAGRVIYLASKDGQAVFQATVSTAGRIGAPTPLVQKKYGRILSVVAAPDGSLWATTTNKDGHGDPKPVDERVLHITPGGGGGTSPA